METILQQDHQNIVRILDKVKQEALVFLNTLEQRPTSTQNRIHPDRILEEMGYGSEVALDEFLERLLPLIVAQAGPRYLGFVTGGATPAAIVGDWLTSIYDQNAQATNSQGGVSALIELETIHLLRQLLNLPNSFLGGFVTGATMANFTGLAVARQWFGKELGKDFAKEGITEKITVFSANQHSSSVKCLAMLGIGSQNVIKIQTLEGDREAIAIADLEKQIQTLNGAPFVLISSAGTVNTADFDDFVAISKLKEKYRFWWHIDAAFGGFAAVSSQYKHLVSGWEHADSITVDAHKWLNVPYESAFYLIKEECQLLQIESFQNTNAPYLGNPLENFNYLNFLPENSRRLKALPVWFSLVAYGKKGVQEWVENSIKMAQLLTDFIANSSEFELLAPTRLNNVCFTLKGNEKQEKVSTFLETLNDTGSVFMTPTVLGNQKGIRASFVNWRTTEKDIQFITDIMQEVASKLK
ncbi:pyridoxal phosphate-dependent decarboxylase family protein [Flavobacterium agrisoli]|uniref:Aspartate aminotransferase family protein n=1 Tax=Flavobacterium agrisoli TaxID=2793066 RepID=A0A934UK29_9FLAO|nr:pyridoxal-dependent decarboxylase [Flavobacterium agrisoli]MBK0370621.1 aspartate aminotransferase family protein [Flavobacterium agrisoli]